MAADLIDFIKFLLPGFLAAWIFYAFTAYEKPQQFERIIQALIFTIIVEAVRFPIEFALTQMNQSMFLSMRPEQKELFISTIIAILVGFIFVGFANSNRFHRGIAKLKLSRETSYASEWFGEFTQKVTWVVLHLSDGRRLYGWPKEWPSQCDSGHFAIQNAYWINDENKLCALTGVESILIRAQDVEMVEFMEKGGEVTDEYLSS